jgi:signal transduction histidine kinase
MDDGVSRRHARVWRGDDGRILVRDLRSRNGTFVNGTRIEGEVELDLGDRIALGAQTMLELTAYDRLEDQRVQAQKLAAIGQLAGGIAHDFNNLLGVVLANVTYLLQLPQLEEKLAREVLGDVETAARRAVELTQELLAFARSRPLELQSLGVNDLVGESHRLLRTRAKGGVTFDISGDAGLTVLADRSRMMQVLMNLGINALDAMPSGGVLRMHATHSTAQSRSDDADARALVGECVRIAVEDSGIGMDAATASRVFEPLFKNKPRGQGTGLGLPTV